MDRLGRITLGFVAAVWIAALLPASVQSQEASRPAAVDQVKRGETWFYQRCSLCHLGRVLKNEAHESMARSLEGLFKSAPPTREADVRILVQSGNLRMPGFRYLDRDQLDDLIAYLKTL